MENEGVFPLKRDQFRRKSIIFQASILKGYVSFQDVISSFVLGRSAGDPQTTTLLRTWAFQWTKSTRSNWLISAIMLVGVEVEEFNVWSTGVSRYESCFKDFQVCIIRSPRAVITFVTIPAPKNRAQIWTLLPFHLIRFVQWYLG